MKIIGHRGARGLAPENTLAGLGKALEHGVDMVEFDVRVTKDRIPVLHHDAAVKINGNELLIDRHGYQELLALKPDLAKLSEALSFLGGNLPIYLEIKPGVGTRPIIKLLRGFKGDVLVGSKSQAVCLEIHAALPDMPLIVIEPWSGVRATRRARRLNTKYIAMNQKWLWRGFIRPMAKRGWLLMAYPLNDKAKAKRWADYGLYGVITDYPDRFPK